MLTVAKLVRGGVEKVFYKNFMSQPFCSTGTCTLANMPKKSALVLLAEGSEEMEFVISADVLRRAGLAVTVAGVDGNNAFKCSRDVSIVPDASLDDALKNGPYDVVVLPGGLGGAKKFAEARLTRWLLPVIKYEHLPPESKKVGEILKEQESSGRWVAAICAAPTALQAHNVFLGKQLTSYPSFKEKLENQYKYLEDKVVVDGKLITSRGPGTAFDFALAIADQLLGSGACDPVKKAMLLA